MRSRSGELKPEHPAKWKRVVIQTSYVLLCVCAVGAGAMANLVNTYPLARYELMRRIGITPQNPYQGKDSLTVLLLGCDENYTYGGGKVLNPSARADSIHLVRFDFKNKGIGMFDIPRDSRVSVPGHHGVKITALHVYGGEEMMIEGVYQLTGIRAEKVVTVNYDFIKKLVDLVGGVEIFVEKDMDYDDNAGKLHIHLKRGWQTLDGVNAVGFMRFRHTDSTERRSKRQEEFMLALKDTIAKNPSVLPDISNLLLDTVKTSLGEQEVDFLAHFGKELPTNRVKRGGLPGTWNESNWQYLVDEDAVPKALQDAGITPELGSGSKQ